MKTLQITHGPKHDQKTETVQVLGVLANAKLTPALARMAARIGAGHEYGVTVMELDGSTGYRIYSPKRNSHRKVNRKEVI